MVKGNKGLKKGLGAFLPDDFDALEEIDSSKEEVKELNIEDIRPNPYQPRKVFNEESLQELADSIATQGVFQPIIVRKSAIRGYELIAGERRLRASKMAHKTTIPAIVREYSEEIMIQIAVIENLQREDLRPIDEALAYQTLMTNLKLTQEEVASRVGKSRSYVTNYLRLLTLPSHIQDYVQQGVLSAAHARTLLALKDNSKLKELTKTVMAEEWSVRKLEQVVAELNEPTKKTPKKKIKIVKPAYIVESEERLMDKFGTSVQITEKGDKGKIEIEYLSQQDLTRILELLEIEFD